MANNLAELSAAALSFENDRDLQGAIQNGDYRPLQNHLEKRTASGGSNINASIQLAILYFRSGQWGKCSKLASSAVHHYSTQGEHTALLKLLRDVSNVYVAGALTPALETAREVGSTFLQDPYDLRNKYSATLVEMYLRAVKQVYIFSTWLNGDDTGGPWKPTGSRDWTDFAEYAIWLCDQGHFYQAWLILKLLYSVEPIQLKLIELLADFTTKCRLHAGDLSADLSAATATIWRCQLIKSRLGLPPATTVMNAAKELYNSLADEAKVDSSVLFDFQYLCLEFDDSLAPQQRARNLKAMSSHAQKCMNLTRADEFLAEACELAILEDMSEYEEWQELHDHLMEHKMKNNRDLIGARTRHWRHRSGAEISAQLLWYDRFEQQMSEEAEGVPFDDPSALYVRELARASLFSMIQERTSEAESKARIMSLQASLPLGNLKRNAGYFRDFVNVSVSNGLEGIRVVLPTLQNLMRRGEITGDETKALVGSVSMEKSEFTEGDAMSVAQMHFQPSTLKQWPTTFATLQKIFVKSRPTQEEQERGQYLLYRLQVLRASRMISFQDGIQEQQRLLDFIDTCVPPIRKEAAGQSFDSFWFMAKYQKAEAQVVAQFDEAMSSCHRALRLLQKYRFLTRDVQRLGRMHVLMAEIAQHRRHWCGNPPWSEIREHLGQAEVFFNAAREDIILLPLEMALQRQSRFAIEVQGVQTLQDVGLNGLLWKLNHQSYSDLQIQELWDWVQRSKNRTMTDRMALTVRVPSTLIDRSRRRSEEAEKIVDSWLSVEQRMKARGPLGNMTAHDGFYLQRQRRQALDRMRDWSETSPLERVIRGRTIKFEDVSQLCQSLTPAKLKKRPRFVFADWIITTPRFNEQRLYVLVTLLDPVNSDSPTVLVREIPLHLNAVAQWINKYLKQPLMQPPDPGAQDPVIAALRQPSAYQELQLLESIMIPINDVLEPDDFVVLCPSGELHRLPLHAIDLPATATKSAGHLLDTHDFAYCHSLSALQQCSDLSQSTDKSQSTPLGVFPLTTQYMDRDMHDDFVNATEGGRLILGADVTSDRVLESSVGCPHLMFFGHVHDNAHLPLNSHLCLYEDTLHTNCNAEGVSTNILTASRMLSESKLASGAHVDIIGCASGTPSRLGADEYLGLVPALLCAGAGSTVSTLWAVDSWRAVDWVRKYLILMSDTVSEDNLVNIAACTRQASLWMKAQKESTFPDWAGFVFHGYWNRTVS